MPIRQLFGSPFGPSPQWTDHEDLVFSSAAGSFTVRQQVLLIDLSPSLTVGTSHWVILTGTGAYAELQGQGTGTVTIDWDAGTLDLTMVGQVQPQTM